MLRSLSKAAGSRLALPGSQPGLIANASPLAFQAVVVLAPGLRGHASGSGVANHDDSRQAAQQAADDFARAAQDSVKHASEGDVPSSMQDAMRMAMAGMKGAAENARLVFEKVAGLGTGSDAAGSAAGRAASVADSVAKGASSAVSQAAGMTAGSGPPKGYAGQESGTGGMAGGPTREWAGVMAQSGADEAGGASVAGGEDLGSTAKGSGAGGAGFAGLEVSGAGATGLSSSTAREGRPVGPREKASAEEEFVVEGGGEGRGGWGLPGGGGGVGRDEHSERSEPDDEETAKE